MKVLITPRGFASYGLEEIKKMRALGIEVHTNDTGLSYTHEEFCEYAADADGIIVGVDLMDSAMMSQCPNLKVVCKFGVGTDNIDTDYASERGIVVGRTVGSNSLAVAEHVLALMFSQAKNVVKTVEDVKNGKWNKYTGSELYGKTLGIVGFGAIGKHLARMAKGLGMSVIAYDAFPVDKKESDAYGVSMVSLDAIYESSDFLSLHIPLTEDTRNMISTEQFKRMKTNACLVNAARGGIVDEHALYEALVAKEIKAACFDVFSSEPPTVNEPLLSLDSFTLTSHTAARTEESEKRTCALSTQIVLEALGY